MASRPITPAASSRSRRSRPASDDDKLVMMANQIGKFYGPQRQVEPVGAIATHIRKFWDPRMRAAIISHLDHGGAGLDAPVREAVQRLKGLV